MRMGDGDGERVGGVGAVEHRARQQAFHHGPDLALVAMAGADHRLLHRVRRIFGDRSPSSAGTSRAMPRAWPSFKRGRGVAIDESLLDGRLLRRKPRQHLLQTIEDLAKPGAQAFLVIGDDRAAGHEGEPHPVGVDHPPAGAPEPRVDADNANCGRPLCKAPRQRAFPLDAPTPAESLGDFAMQRGAGAPLRNGGT